MYFALWALAGSLLMASTWFLSFAHIPRGWLRMLIFLIPFAVGSAASIWGIKRLNEETWNEAELARVQAFVENPFLKCATWVWIAFVFILFILHFIFQHADAGNPVVLLFPLNMVVLMRRQLLTPRKPRDGLLQDWRSFEPIQSEHWGEPSRR